MAQRVRMAPVGIGGEGAQSASFANRQGYGTALSEFASRRRLGHFGVRQAVQTKLPVSGSNDPLEMAADRVADAVIRMPEPSVAAPRIQRAHTKGDDELQRDGGAAIPAVSGANAAYVGNLSGGAPLPESVRSFMEPRFGVDFSRVRVHADDAADRSAESMGALAYTRGDHIVFRAGHYQPTSEAGRRLLAHELTHVIQQRGVVGAPPVQCEEDDKSKPKSEGKPEAKAAWSRKLTNGPRLLDGQKPSYQVFFDHVLPPVPAGKTQLWQVVEQKQTILTDKCNVENETNYIVDVVKIGSRTAINDNWASIRRDDPCFAVETNAATVGFDDGKSNYAQQTNVKVTAQLAKELLGKITGPTGTYAGVYTFVKSGNCPKCKAKLKELQNKHKAPNGEALSIDGVGSWTS